MSDAPPEPIPSEGGDFAIAISTTASCGWSASSGSAFISISGPTSGVGPGSVRFAAQANGSAQRVGSVQVAGRQLTVMQSGTEASACAFSVSPTEATVTHSGGTLVANVVATGGIDCTWNAVAHDSFLTIAGGAAGTGSGAATVEVVPNGGDTRVGTATVAGRVVTVLQAAAAPTACAFSVAPTQTTVSSSGGNVLITVQKTQGQSCPWIAQSQNPFVAIAGASSGTNDGSVMLSIAVNGGAARTGSVMVAGHTVTVTQAAPSLPCALSIQPTTSHVGATTGSTFTIVSQTQGDVCPWTAESLAPWLTVTAGATGVGTAGVTVGYPQNPGEARSGTVRVAGHTFTVVQAGANDPCSLEVSPSHIDAGAGQMSMMIYVRRIAGQNCAWSAQSSSPFVTLEPAGGVIPGLGWANSMVFVAANSGAARSATVTIGNATLTVSQAGALPAGAAAVLSFDSDPADSVGHGQAQTLTWIGPQFETVLSPFNNSLTVQSAFGTSPSAILVLAPPTGSPLAPGYYPTAQRFSSNGVAGVSFGFQGHVCNQVTGRMLISEASYGPGNTIDRFHARFEQHCEGQSAALRGQIWIDAQGSTTPPPLPPFPQDPAGATTVFSYVSAPGDVIGGGGSGALTLANATFTPSHSTSDPEVRITVRPAAGPPAVWTLLFRAAAGQVLLPGEYRPTADPLTPGVAQLRVAGLGFCGVPSTGAFTVHEAVYGANSEVRRFHATFELRCATEGPVFRGEVRIVADPWR